MLLIFFYKSSQIQQNLTSTNTIAIFTLGRREYAVTTQANHLYIKFIICGNTTRAAMSDIYGGTHVVMQCAVRTLKSRAKFDKNQLI